MRGRFERFEYIRQPHIIGLIVLAVLLVAIAVFTASRRLAEISRSANKTTEQRCLDYVNDQDLCRFVAVQETTGHSNYISTTIEIIEGQEQTTTLEVENPNRMRSITSELVAEREAYILLDNKNYAKDYTDGVWAEYTDPAYVPEAGGIVYDFSSATGEDVMLFRDNYAPKGTEPCGSLTCFKYQITDNESPTATTYIWFDNQSYLIQRYQSVDGESRINTNYVYQPVIITAPSPTKTVTEDEIMQLLE